MVPRDDDRRGDLAAALGGLEVDDSLDRLGDLVAGEAGDRRWAAQVAGQAGRREDVGVLMTLAADTDPDVRAAAASALAILVATARGGPPALLALMRCISDPGARVPAHVANTLRAVGGDVADELLTGLRNHPSAFVRLIAGES